MRATLITDSVVLTPGQPGTVVLEVTNTLAVIDGVTATVVAVDGLTAATTPAILPLFPGSTGQLAVSLTVGGLFPAGSHQIRIDVVSSLDAQNRVELILPVQVVPVPAASVSVDPPVRRARRRSRYQVTCTNEGNTVLDLELAAADPARALTVKVAPPSVVLAPGTSATAELRVHGRIHVLGGERRQRVSVVARAGELEYDASASFRHAPLIPAGARTTAVLAVIVALWAGVFLVAIKKANSSDPLTKAVPPSFYAALASSTQINTSAFGALGRTGLLASATDGDLPAGAVPKSGVVIGVGGTVSGTVIAASTQAGVGRITVEAYRNSPHGPVLVSSAATATDGTYSLVGLLPGDYQLDFNAPGYQDIWYPQAASQSQATPVTVAAQATTDGINATVTGLTGSITGVVDTGETPAPPVTVSVLPEQGGNQVVATVTTDSSGNYTIPNLPTPGSYDLSFTAPGYQVASDTEELAGGEAHIANTITMSAGPGTLGGVVTDGTKPLGGVTITANANGQTVTSATPTAGTVGQFSIPNLATPGTYLLTFSAPGYGTDTVAESLGPGQSLTNLSIALAGGAGQISGEVTSASGTPLGGVTVAVDNSSSKASTQTLTGGSIGSYLLSGLATPGTYTLTFSLAGYQPQTISVPLGSSGSASAVSVKLSPVNGSISGTVTSSSGTPLSGVTVTVTDGTTVRTTATTSSPAGGFSLLNLPPSSYSVTFSVTGYQSTTVLVHLAPGQAATASATMAASP